MNILTDQLPTAVLVNGVETAINADFRACLRVLMAYEDNELTNFEKQLVMLSVLFPERPADALAACEVALRFLNGGKPSSDEGGKPRLFSWAKDAELIFAAFKQTHGVDLDTAELHWWKFMALFMDLGQDTAFCQLTGLRKRVANGTATKEERRAAAEMGEAFDVPEVDTHTLDEKERANEFFRLVEEGQQKQREAKA